MSLNTTLRAASARDLGPQFHDNPNRMSGQDCAYSIPLEEDVFWIFGDTFVGERPVDQPMPHGPEMPKDDGFEKLIFNCGLRCRDETGAGGLTSFEYIAADDGAPRELVRPFPGEDRETYRFWAFDGCYVNDTLYLYYSKIRMFDADDNQYSMGFEAVGAGLAAGSPDDFQFTRVEVDGTTMLWERKSPSDPLFGSAVMAERDDDYVYVYGAGSGSHSSHHCYVARVDVDAIEDVTAYEYYSERDSTWYDSVTDATPLFDGFPNEMSVSYNEYLDSYLAIHSLDLTGNIVGRTAPEPWGPWSSPTILWSVDPVHATLPSEVPIYAAKDHPELATDGGRVIYVTYIEYSEYFPHLVEIELV